MINRNQCVALVVLLIAGVVSPLLPGARAATLKPCTAIQKAQITNYIRQYSSLAELREGFEKKLSTAKAKFDSASATGNTAAAALAKLDIESVQGSIDSYNRQMTEVRRKQGSITTKCKYSETSTSTEKKKACTSLVKSKLYSLASQYQYQQSLLKVYSEEIDAIRIKYDNAISRGKLSDAQQLDLDIQKYQQDLQRAYSQASLIKQEFAGYNASCTGSGITLPKDYVASPDSDQTNPTNSEQEVCSSAMCMPSTWGDLQSIASVVGGPLHETADFGSDLMVSCSTRGSGSIGVSNARIVMAFTASTSWRKNYISKPTESDFFRRDSEISGASPTMKYFDVPTNVARYGTALTTEFKKIQYIPAITLTSHLCDANVPFIFDVDTKISPQIAGVGFFYLATVSDGRTLMVFLSGFDVQSFMKPRFTVGFSLGADQITYSGEAFGIIASTGSRDLANWQNNRYFGRICFRVDGIENEKVFPCIMFINYWSDVSQRNLFSGTLSTTSLAPGTHTLEMYVPNAPNKEISNARFTFVITR